MMKTMWHLIKKFSFYFVIFFIILTGFVFPTFNHDRLTGPDPLSLIFVLYLMPYLFMGVLAPIWTHEQMESKTNGYSFLFSLPIDAKDIVVAKFTVLFFSVCLYTVFHCVFFFMISQNPDYLNPACTITIINANICLILAALLYLGIFRHGYIKFGKFVILAWMGVIISPIPIYHFLLPRLGIKRLDLIDLMGGLSWPLVTVISLGIYLGLMRLSIKALKRAKGYGG